MPTPKNKFNRIPLIVKYRHTVALKINLLYIDIVKKNTLMLKILMINYN